MPIRLTPRRVLRIVVTAVLFFTIANLIGQFWRVGLGHHSFRFIVRQFSLDDELNIPTAYQAITLGCCALLLWTIAWREKRLGRRHVFQWALLGCIFLLLANDEAFRIHERLGQFRDDLPMGLGREFRTGWVMFGLIFVAIVGLVYLPFLWRLPRRFAILFIIAGAIYVGGAVGMEIIEDPWVDAHGRDNMHYQLMSTVEEDMEMTGIAIFLWALTMYLAPFQSRLLKVEQDEPLAQANPASGAVVVAP